MKNTLFKYAASGLFAVALSTSVNALSIFTLPPRLKLTLKMVEIDGQMVEQATRTVKEVVVVDNVSSDVFKTQKEAVKVNLDGSKENIVTQVQMTVTPKPGEDGVFVVETKTVTTVTPVSSEGVAGTPVVSDPPATTSDVEQVNLVLPPVSEVEIDGAFSSEEGKTNL